MRVDLDELERLEKAATPGPLDVVLVRGDSSLLAGDICVAECDPDVDEKISPDQAWNNAMCFAAARNALPALIAELRALREQRDALLAACKFAIKAVQGDTSSFVEGTTRLKTAIDKATVCLLAAHRKGDQP